MFKTTAIRVVRPLPVLALVLLLAGCGSSALAATPDRTVGQPTAPVDTSASVTGVLQVEPADQRANSVINPVDTTATTADNPYDPHTPDDPDDLDCGDDDRPDGEDDRSVRRDRTCAGPDGDDGCGIEPGFDIRKNRCR